MTLRLPSPSARPAASIVVYDGMCRFCMSQVRLLHALDLTGALSFLSLHEPFADALLPDVPHHVRMQAMIVIDPHGSRHFGARAVRALSWFMPALWPLLPFLHFPGSIPLWEALYNAIARTRYRFGKADCDGGTCHLHGHGGRS